MPYFIDSIRRIQIVLCGLLLLLVAYVATGISFFIPVKVIHIIITVVGICFMSAVILHDCWDIWKIWQCQKDT